jgi:hypothetical protein
VPVDLAGELGVLVGDELVVESHGGSRWIQMNLVEVCRMVIQVRLFPQIVSAWIGITGYPIDQAIRKRLGTPHQIRLSNPTGGLTNNESKSSEDR